MLQWYSLLASTSLSSSLPLAERAGRWFLESGIQDSTGGVARYYLTDAERNAPVSAEITGYALSFLVWSYNETGDGRYLEAALKAGRFLVHDAWDKSSATFPFEALSPEGTGFAYFFDCGIIVRGLLALWRATGDSTFLERAKEAAVAMAFDFHSAEAMHPIIRLPEKEPLDYEPRWSREPGCYQLKSAMAWRDVATATGQSELNAAYERMLAYALATHAAFLPGDTDSARVMDRLHAYSYFLEALLPVAARPEVAVALAEGIRNAGCHLREIAPIFERSDVYGQLLRVRLYAHDLGAVPLDYEAASHEAEMAGQFQCAVDDSRFSGGFWFGRKGTGLLPFMNPVSTAFCAQALTSWQQFQRGGFRAAVEQLI